MDVDNWYQEASEGISAGGQDLYIALSLVVFLLLLMLDSPLYKVIHILHFISFEIN